jgi:outer membrane protein
MRNSRRTFTMNFRLLKLAAAISAAAMCASVAQAQSAGSIVVRGGATQIRPDVTSSDLTAPAPTGTKADIKAASQVSGGITYMLTDHVAIDLPLALPFEHEIVGDGAIAGVGKIGEVKVLPATLLAQYRFMPANAAVRPYVGGGLTYAKFFKARSTATLSGLTGGTPANPTTLKVDSKLALSLQVGASVALNDRWSLDASLVHTFLKTRTTLSTGQTLDTKLDPNAISVAVGYRF